MRFFRTALASFAAAATIAAMGVSPARAAGPDVYTTPGGHIQNGRLWATDCEMYSSNVVRCITKIWSTQVQYSAGSYKRVTGWHFNNLTYLPSPRSVWATNPLGKNGQWSSAGRQWKTVCDDPATTGRGACRSYVWADVVSAQPIGSGWVYYKEQKWVFNNLVLFSTPSIPPVTKIPGYILDVSVLTPTGLGPLQRGVKSVDLQRLGYLRWNTYDASHSYWVDTQPLINRGISLRIHEPRGLDSVFVDVPGIRTADGAKVGMTVGQVKAIYGSAFKVVPKENYGETQYFGSVRFGDDELQFRVKGPGDDYAPSRPLVDSDVIAEMGAQKYTEDVSFDGP